MKYYILTHTWYKENIHDLKYIYRINDCYEDANVVLGNCGVKDNICLTLIQNGNRF